MKKILFALLILLSFSQISGAQEKNCKKYQNGVFKLVDTENNVTYLIERNGKKQFEQIVGKDLKIEFEVKWINDCTYTLHPTKESIEILKDDFVLFVEITEIKENSLVLRMYADKYPNEIMTNEVQIVKPI